MERPRKYKRLQALPLSNVPTVDSYNTWVSSNSPGTGFYICIIVSLLHCGRMIGILLSYPGTLIIRAIAWSRQLCYLTVTNLMNSRRRQRRARKYLSVTSNCLVNYVLDLAHNLVLLVVPDEYPDGILKKRC